MNLHLLSPDAEAAKVLHHRVFQHRETGQVRAVEWTEGCCIFACPETQTLFRRPHRKALDWCEQAEDITPEPEPVDPNEVAIPVETLLQHAVRVAVARSFAGQRTVQAEIRLPAAIPQESK